MTVQVDFRCDANPRRLFARLLQSDEPRHVDPDNLICFACRDCRRNYESEYEYRPKDIIHRYALDGVLVDTVVVEE